MKTTYDKRAVGLSVKDGRIVPVDALPEYPFEGREGMSDATMLRFRHDTAGMPFPRDERE